MKQRTDSDKLLLRRYEALMAECLDPSTSSDRKREIRGQTYGIRTMLGSGHDMLSNDRLREEARDLPPEESNASHPPQDDTAK